MGVASGGREDPAGRAALAGLLGSRRPARRPLEAAGAPSPVAHPSSTDPALAGASRGPRAASRHPSAPTDWSADGYPDPMRAGHSRWRRENLLAGGHGVAQAGGPEQSFADRLLAPASRRG